MLLLFVCRQRLINSSQFRQFNPLKSEAAPVSSSLFGHNLIIEMQVVRLELDFPLNWHPGIVQSRPLTVLFLFRASGKSHKLVLLLAWWCVALSPLGLRRCHNDDFEDICRSWWWRWWWWWWQWWCKRRPGMHWIGGRAGLQNALNT